MAELSKNVEESRFEAHVDGQLAGYTDYAVGHGVITLPDTQVGEQFRGRGLASEIIQFALDDIRGQGYRVNPVCPYVQRWIERHPDYADLVHVAQPSAEQAADVMEDVTGINVAGDPRI